MIAEIEMDPIAMCRPDLPITSATEPESPDSTRMGPASASALPTAALTSAEGRARRASGAVSTRTTSE
ncbi:hypothetical protein BS330_13335 [Amycolatopsis keratiniphila subsp. nogabecina]|nr:hypothetical protein BS330_13335 [Amycolatopsis keratiniphila subsp. nogabecina]